MEKKTQSKKSILVRMAYHVGERSVGRCCHWFNQPQVPGKLKEMVKTKESK